MVETSAPAVARRVLVVDGDPTFGQSLHHDFGTQSFEVETAGTAEEAVAWVAAHPPDLVVLDLYLAGGGALKLLRLWKAELPDLTVILVSGHASLNIVVDALNEGAQRFFTKPVTAAQMIEEFDERQRARRRPAPSDLAPDHQLGTAALKTEGVDRFFAISPGLMSVAGFDGYFKMLNPAWEQVLGYSIDELCAKPYFDLVHPDDREKARDEALEMRGGQTIFRFKNRYRCRDGSYRWLAWNATPSPAHRLVYGSARDVTGSVRMEQGLRESNEQLKRVVASRELSLRESVTKNDDLVELGRFKDEVTAMLVHDLKNPLAVIVSNYDYILEGIEGPPDCLEALRDSQSAGRRMLRLLANLVDVARLENGSLALETAAVDLSSLLRPIAEQRRALARARNISMTFTLLSESTLVVDPDLLTRTIENILDNAFRHTPTGGRIEIECEDVGPDVEIRIGNTGVAIATAARGAIFEKYAQTDAPVGRMNLGLGLYFCRLAVEAHGGRIWVEETAPLPTVFAIRLPRRAAPTVTPLRSEKPIPPA